MKWTLSSSLDLRDPLARARLGLPRPGRRRPGLPRPGRGRESMSLAEPRPIVPDRGRPWPRALGARDPGTRIASNTDTLIGLSASRRGDAIRFLVGVVRK